MSKKSFYSCNKIRGILAGFLSQFIHPYLWIMHDISPLIAAFIFNTHFRSIKTIAPPTQGQLASIETVYSLFQWIGAVFGHPLALKIGHRNLMAITSILSAILQFICSFCDQSWQFFTVLGVLNGFVLGQNYFIGLNSAWNRFKQRSPFILSVIQSGFPFGVQFFMAFTNYLVNPDSKENIYSYDVSMRIPHFFRMISLYIFSLGVLLYFIMPRYKIKQAQYNDHEFYASEGFGNESPGRDSNFFEKETELNLSHSVTETEISSTDTNFYLESPTPETNIADTRFQADDRMPRETTQRLTSEKDKSPKPAPKISTPHPDNSPSKNPDLAIPELQFFSTADVTFDSIGFSDTLRRLILCTISIRFLQSFMALILPSIIDSYAALVWTEISGYYFRRHSKSIVPITIYYRVQGNATGRLVFGLMLRKWDSIWCLNLMNSFRLVQLVVLWFGNSNFHVFFGCIGCLFFCGGGRNVCSVLLSNKLFGKINAQLLVPIYFSTEIFAGALGGALIGVFGLNSWKLQMVFVIFLAMSSLVLFSLKRKKKVVSFEIGKEEYEGEN